MEGTGYCMGCMHKLDWDGRCHYCGFDERNYKKDQQLGLLNRAKIRPSHKKDSSPFS